MIFPKVTYDWDEFINFHSENQKIMDAFDECDLYELYLGWYSEYGKGCIWLNKPSAITLLHEFLHHVGFKLSFPKYWHHLIEELL